MVAVQGQRDGVDVDGFERRARRDALPENTQYADTGCDVHPSCLTCPLVRCRYDVPGGVRRLMSEGRDLSMVEMQRAGNGVDEIARRCGVSRRTVFRVLARSRSRSGSSRRARR
jgi:Homeodomain-like domain